MAQKKYTMKVVGFVTFIAEEGIDPAFIPVKIDVIDNLDDEISPVMDVLESDVVVKEISSSTDV